mmetsp:Transcript_24793/g.75513  ORF Transcript_24793/g.75513 Transcript_24793/m.75513 type:complete len:128 (-) Transcript_24793:76-459(-)|eukprot:scaffold229295_cov32-Tisochrysis_lutea.AAC.3
MSVGVNALRGCRRVLSRAWIMDEAHCQEHRQKQQTMARNCASEQHLSTYTCNHFLSLHAEAAIQWAATLAGKRRWTGRHVLLTRQRLLGERATELACLGATTIAGELQRLLLLGMGACVWCHAVCSA